MKDFSLAHWEMMAESIPVGMAIIQKDDGKIVFVNNRFIELMGSNPVGLTFREYSLNIVKARMFENGPYLFEQLPSTKALLYGKTTYDQEIVVYKPDNQELMIMVSAKPIIGDKGEIIGALSIFADASERKKAHEALKKSEENYRHLLRYAPTAIFEIDYAVPRFWNVNDAMSTLTGYTEEELLTMNPFELLEPESAGRLKDRIRRGSAGEQIGEIVEYKVVTKDRRHLWVILYIKAVYREGKLSSALVVGYDITERKKNEEKLKQSEEQLRIEKDKLSVTYHNVSEILYSLSVEASNRFRFSSVNQPFLDATGLQENQVIGKTVNEVIPEPSLKLVLEKYNLAIQEKKPVRWEEVTDYPAGKKYGEVTVAPLFDWTGRPVYLIGSVHDITERKQAEEKREQYKNQLERLVEERTKQLETSERLAGIGQTAAMVGHDIRNPLQAIIGDLYLIQQEISANPSCASEGIAESISAISENIIYMDKIVSDLQDYTKVLKPNLEIVNLKDVINKAVAERKIPNNITIEIQAESGLKLKTDQTFLRRIMTNLITNGIQAMPNGGKLIIDSFEEDNKAFIHIQDTGLGIPEEAKPNLFKPLFTTKSKGQGLGLAVVKRLIEALGGSITFESKEGQGTKFTIMLFGIE